MRLMDPAMPSRKVAVRSPGGQYVQIDCIAQKAKIGETPVEVVKVHRTGSVSCTDTRVVLRPSELAVLAPYRNAHVGEIEMIRKSTPSYFDYQVRDHQYKLVLTTKGGQNVLRSFSLGSEVPPVRNRLPKPRDRELWEFEDPTTRPRQDIWLTAIAHRLVL